MTNNTHVILPIEPNPHDIRRMARVARAMKLKDGFTLFDYALTIYMELVRPYAEANGVTPAISVGLADAASDPPPPDAG